ncbi:succinylglutamate desuccinylase/aspartoacylase family protein [Pseudorhodoferax sp.]|uniref:succinylglutamate desuccinylase/aspartoacylase family protein n=1 Tax=Pseudorhodoferax sp. TaxID=1993553 RepID=UPI0039E6C2FC
MRFPNDEETLRLHGFAALRPGPRLLVLGGVHGDETCGTAAVERLRAELDGGRLALSAGELTLVPVANPLARRLGRREGERNLNRSFQPSARPADHEARLTNLLCPVLARHDVLLDLHSFQSAGAPFAMIGPRDNAGPLEPFARAVEEGRLAWHLGTDCVVEAWLDVYAARLARLGRADDAEALAFGWGTNEYMRSQGGYAVTLECGQHRDPQAPEVAYQAIRAALRLLGMADGPAPAPAHPRVLRLVDVTDRAAPGDRFVRAWASFDRVRAGETIALRADGTPVPAPCDGCIVFPNAEALPASEWFYFAIDSDRRLDA